MSARATRASEGPVDEQVLAGLRAGDPAALEALYDRHAAALLGLALRMLADRGDAEDLVHDVFVEAWRNAATFDPARGGLATWLLVRLRSRAIDRLRRRNAGPVALAPDGLPEAGDVPMAPSAEAGPGREIDRRRARAAMDGLPAEQRAVVALAYFDGLSFREIGARLAIPVSTAKSRMVAAIRTLRRELAEPGGEP